MPILFTCRAKLTPAIKVHDFLAGFLQWCEGSSPDVKRAVLTGIVFLNVDADDKDRPSFSVIFCAQKRVSQTTHWWVF